MNSGPGPSASSSPSLFPLRKPVNDFQQVFYVAGLNGILSFVRHGITTDSGFEVAARVLNITVFSDESFKIHQGDAGGVPSDPFLSFVLLAYSSILSAKWCHI